LKNALTATQRGEKTRRMVFLSLWSAIIIVLAFVPYVGYIPIGPINATTVHIPVIIGAIMLGPADGAFLGFVFGLTSMIHNTAFPQVTSFLFSPFVPLGNYKSALLAIVPRIFIGIVAGYVFILIRKFDKTQFFAAIAAGLAGSITNTILVLGGIYLFFKGAYASQLGKSVDLVAKILMGVVVTQGFVEAAVAAILAAAVSKSLLVAIKNHH
jgi:uncharacterized membrane protein